MSIKYKINHSSINDNVYDGIIIGVYSDSDALTSLGEAINQQSHGYISKLINTKDINTAVGQTTTLYDIPELPARKIILVGCGEKQKIDNYTFKKIVNAAGVAISKSTVTHLQCGLHEIETSDLFLREKIKQLVLALQYHLYRFTTFKSTSAQPLALTEIHLVAKPSDELQKTLDLAVSTSEGVKLSRDLANTPSNVCTPTYLAEQSKELAKQYSSIKTTVLDESKMDKLGMHSLLSVGNGSVEESQLICMEYYGADKAEQPIVFVGKGITYDSGGINIKLAMLVEMRYDMCGASTVIGLMKAIADAKLPVNVVGIVAAAENMPSGSATRPNDIIKSMSGKTIEVLNTDAEGRLVLCDALTYSERYNPKTIIDIATLTGAIIVALGHVATGVMSNNQQLADDLINAGNKANDLAWQLPLFEDYQDILTSDYADLPNIGPKMQAGSITAACFLSRFIDKVEWAHLDIAGTASNAKEGSTGRPIALLMQYLENQTH